MREAPSPGLERRVLILAPTGRDGELTKKLTVHAHKFSAGALSKIEGKGGKAVELPKVAAAAQKAEEG